MREMEKNVKRDDKVMLDAGLLGSNFDRIKAAVAVGVQDKVFQND